MLRFKEFTNGTDVFNEVFMNIDTEEIIFTRESEKDDLFNNVYGFIKCLEYMKIDYDFSFYNSIELFPDDKMFKKCEFKDKSFGRYKSYGNYRTKEENDNNLI